MHLRLELLHEAFYGGLHQAPLKPIHSRIVRLSSRKINGGARKRNDGEVGGEGEGGSRQLINPVGSDSADSDSESNSRSSRNTNTNNSNNHDKNGNNCHHDITTKTSSKTTKTAIKQQKNQHQQLVQHKKTT